MTSHAASLRHAIFSHSMTSNWQQLGFLHRPYFLVDIDECLEQSHQCHEEAVCTNNIGSYTCSCRPGFIGTGESCMGEYVYYIICQKWYNSSWHTLIFISLTSFIINSFKISEWRNTKKRWKSIMYQGISRLLQLSNGAMLI